MVISIYLSAEDKNIFLSFLQPGLDFSAYFIFHCVLCVVPGIIFCSIMFYFSKVQSGLLVGAFFSVLKKTTLVSLTVTELGFTKHFVFLCNLLHVVYNLCHIYISSDIPHPTVIRELNWKHDISSQNFHLLSYGNLVVQAFV